MLAASVTARVVSIACGTAESAIATKRALSKAVRVYSITVTAGAIGFFSFVDGVDGLELIRLPQVRVTAI